MSIAALCQCCGESPCTIQADTFDGDLSAFTEIGTPTIDAGAAVLDSGDGLVTTGEPADYADPVILTVIAGTADEPATLRLAVAYEDANHYLFGEYAIADGAGTLRLGVRDGGVDNWLTEPEEVEDEDQLGDATELTLCWVPGPVQVGGSFEILGLQGITVLDPLGAWINKDNVLGGVPDGVAAQYPFIEGGLSGSLIMRDFPVVVPPGSIIDGIKIYVTMRDGSEADSQIRLSALRLLDRFGNGVGDIRSEAGVAAFNPNWSSYAHGGENDTLNAGITWEDVNSGSFGLFVVVENLAEFERQAEIDHMGMDIWFTTPDRQPGRLTVSRGNVTVATVDCDRAYNVEAPGEGKQAMVMSGGGTWDLHSLNYRYHEADAKPSCPTCAEANGGCSDIGQGQSCPPCCPTVAFRYLVDFGVGGWEADAPCDNECDVFTGEVEVTYGEYFPDTAICEWFFQFGSTDCPGNNSLWGLVLLSLIHEEEECYWRVFAWVTATVAAVPFNLHPYNWAQWESARFSYEEECDMPIELTKVGEARYQGGVCTAGAMPGTITVEDV